MTYSAVPIDDGSYYYDADSASLKQAPGRWRITVDPATKLYRIDVSTGAYNWGLAPNQGYSHQIGFLPGTVAGIVWALNNPAS